jgi:hypothetical protein
MLSRTTTILVLFLVAPACADEPKPPPSRDPAALLPSTSRGVWQGGLVVLPPGAAEILRTTRAPRTIIVGDPAIVDATVVGEATIAITAKGVGTTNMILLDSDHAEITRGIVQVGPAARSVQVIQGERPQEYACQPTCTAVPVPPASPSYTTTFVTRDNQGNPASTSVSIPNAANERAVTPQPQPGAARAPQR